MIIAIVAAMDNELRPFRKMFQIDSKITISHNVFYIQKLKNITIILVCSGRGKVNSTVYTQLLIDKFCPDLVLNIGVSGGIEQNSNIYDIYIGTDYCHYDVRMKQSKYTFPNKLYYPGDPILINSITATNPNIKKGVFGTGEGFISEEKMKLYLAETFHISAVDMESAALAQCCFLNNIRYISLRGICDKADEKATSTTEKLQEIVSETIAKIIKTYLKDIDNNATLNLG